MERKLLSQRHPIFYFISIWEKRIKRYAKWYLGNQKFSKLATQSQMAYRITQHQSLLIKKLGNSDIQLQHNKIQNLKTAIAKIDGIVINPGETFSFWKLVGYPSKKKGYVKGMVLSRGEVSEGVGGGICQVSNLLHWMVLHSPLTIVERAHHSFDPFPDNGRVLPFGSGAAVFYNYVDFQFKNTTEQPFQVKLWVTEQHLLGELRSNEKVPYSYHVYEKNHEFIEQDQKFFRKNEIWRRVIDRKTGDVVDRELMIKNFSEVKYLPADIKHIKNM